MTQRRTVLFLSYYGPEEAASGIRAGRLARATVLAGERVCFLHGSETGGRELWVDGIELRSFRRSAFLTPHGTSVPGVAQVESRGRARSIVASFIRPLLQPDRFILTRSAFHESAEGVIQDIRNRGDSVVCVAAGPPWSTMIVATRVTEKTDVPLILDLQDLWSANPVRPWPILGHWRAKRWERKALDHARGYVCVNQEISDRFRALLPAAGPKPWGVAPIGLERGVAASLRILPETPLHIGYFGSIYGDRTFETLLEAVACLDPSPARPAIHWYGEIMGDHPMRRSLNSYIAKGVLTLHSPLPHAAARRAMQSCDLLLVVPSPSYPEELTTKFYDYVDAGRPVLALATGQSLLGRLVRESRVGLVVPPSDAAGVRGHLERVMRDGLQLSPDPAPLRSHALPALSEVMAKVLDAAACNLPSKR